jgi:hypothetical protein
MSYEVYVHILKNMSLQKQFLQNIITLKKNITKHIVIRVF